MGNQTRLKDAMRKIIAAGLVALSLTGCMSAPASQTLTASTSEALLAAKKGLIAAHALHEAIAVSLTAAAKSGACVSACAVKAKAYLAQSYAYLLLADDMAAVGDASGLSGRVSAALLLISEAQILIGKN